jgi:hypothetical protein
MSKARQQLEPAAQRIDEVPVGFGFSRDSGDIRLLQ